MKKILLAWIAILTFVLVCFPLLGCDCSQTRFNQVTTNYKTQKQKTKTQCRVKPRLKKENTSIHIHKKYKSTKNLYRSAPLNRAPVPLPKKQPVNYPQEPHDE